MQFFFLSRTIDYHIQIRGEEPIDQKEHGKNTLSRKFDVFFFETYLGRDLSIIGHSGRLPTVCCRKSDAKIWSFELLWETAWSTDFNLCKSLEKSVFESYIVDRRHETVHTLVLWQFYGGSNFSTPSPRNQMPLKSLLTVYETQRVPLFFAPENPFGLI